MGVQWEARVVGTAKNATGATLIVEGVYAECKESEENNLFVEADPGDPLYAAARAIMVAEATERCVKNALEHEYVEIKCDPLALEDAAIVTLNSIGDCPTNATKLIKGDKNFCDPEGSSSSTTEADTGADDESATQPTEAVTTAPTSTQGDTESPTTTGVDTEPSTSEATSSGDETGGSLDLDSLITCSGMICSISQELIDAVMGDAYFLLNDTTRLVQAYDINSLAVGMAFSGITVDGIADRLGFAEGDVILAVEGLPFIDEADFLAVALEIYDASAVTVDVERNGSSHQRVFLRD